MTQTTEAKSATRNGVTLRYIEAGAGDPPIVFVHGWTCSRDFWPGQISNFAKKHRVVALDLRGHGESDKPDEDYTIDAFADDVAWLIGQLGLQKPVVIGHSMGGVIAMKLARKHPDVTSAVVLVDSPILPLPEAMKPLLEQLMAGLQSPQWETIAQGFGSQTFFDANTPPALVEEIRRQMGAPQRVTYTALSSTLAPENQAAGPIPVPSLFIRAQTAYATEDQLRAHIPGMGVITVPAAHFLQMEQPDATNNTISDFLDKLE
jgi:pimeloyl-ACP methyl ester carboxylesterase